MVRLRTETDASGARTDTRFNLSRGISFWGLVGAVMVALKLKESYDDRGFHFALMNLR